MSAVVLARPRAKVDLAAEHLDGSQAEVVANRRALAVQHLGVSSEPARRAASAPVAYVLAHDAGDIARHCALLSPRCGLDDVRVAVAPSGVPGHWSVDIAARDRPGLLAVFTGVLAERYLDVTQAVVATWDDGAALQAFIVRSVQAPDASRLQDHLEEGLGRQWKSDPLFDAVVCFDDDASPAFSRCDVRAGDRLGLLHALALAFAAAGADVHGASIGTRDGVATDAFDLSTRAGRKLSLGMQADIAEHVRDGVSSWSAQRPRSFSFRRW